KIKMNKSIASTVIAMLLPMWLLAQSNLLVGVKNESRKPLIGATVTIKGSLLSGQTNAQGEIQLKHLRDGKAILSVSYLGYETLEKEVSISQDERIEFVLKS